MLSAAPATCPGGNAGIRSSTISRRCRPRAFPSNVNPPPSPTEAAQFDQARLAEANESRMVPSISNSKAWAATSITATLCHSAGPDDETEDLQFEVVDAMRQGLTLEYLQLM